MTYFSSNCRVTASAAACLLMMACSSMPQGAVAPALDGTWTGAAGTTDFNTGGNWSPGGVPTGVATINTGQQADPAIHFSAALTTLSEIRLQGNWGVTIDYPNTVSLTGANGIWMCCNAHSTVNGVLAGNVTLAYQAGQAPRHYLDGKGSVGGNVSHIAGGLVPGGGTPGPGVLSIKGNYTLNLVDDNSGGLVTYVGQRGGGGLAVNGSATLKGPLYVVAYEQITQPMSFAVLKASSINGRFTKVIGQGVSVAVTYNPTDVTLTLTPP